MSHSSDLEEHEQIALRLPWLVNGTLDEASAAQVQAHLTRCERCRADYEAEKRVYAALRAEDTLVFAAEPSYQKLLARIESSEAADPHGSAGDEAGDEREASLREERPAVRTARSLRAGLPRARRRMIGVPRMSSPLIGWLAAAVVLEAVGLGVGAFAWRGSVQSLQAAYITRSTPPPALDGARIKAVFKPQASLAQLAGLLHSVRAQIVAGPTDAGTYTLVFAGAGEDRGELDARLAVLRASPDVVFAEPVNGDGAH